MKKMIAIIVCLVMIMSMSITAFAADSTETKYTLTIKNPTAGHEYEAYQIFSGTLETVNGTNTKVLTNIEWGSAIANSDDLLTAIETAATAEGSLLKKYLDVKGKDAAYLAELMSDNSTDVDALNALASIFAKHISKSSGEMKYEENTDGVYQYNIKDLSAGYYLVKDKDGSLNTEYDSYTRYILRVTDDTLISPKSDVPSVEKSINDTLDGTYGEYEDFDINDTAYYKWEGKLPSNLKDYETYYYRFHDTLPIGIDYLNFEQIYIEGHDGNKVHTFFDAKDAEKNKIENLPEGISVQIGDNTVELVFNDLKKIYPNILPTQKIIVKYSARVTRDAVVAKPMTNSVYVEFSNDPNAEGEGTHPTGQTPEDVAHAFTFQINVDKYDADNKEAKLAGAEFKLYYERTENDVIVKYYAQVVTEEMIAKGELVNEIPVTQKDLGVVYGWTTNEEEASILDTDDNGAIALRGLDADIYYLSEIKAPAGYNLMEKPVIIEILPDYSKIEKGTSINVNYKVNYSDQVNNNKVGVSNSSGSTLPVTGGMGTILFYAFGAVLVIGAVVLLVTKRRVS